MLKLPPSFSLSALALFCVAASFTSGAPAAEALRSPSTAKVAADISTADARTAAHWIAEHADNQRLPFVIVDKKNAQAFVFDGNRRLKGSTKVLLGLAVGDKGLVDMQGRAVASLKPFERTTPAGRFEAEPGRNLQGEKIIWFDYDAQLAIHRLRPDSTQERRAQRLQTPTAADNRISMGCVVVPVAFYEQVIEPVLGNGRSVVYVLPETQPLHSTLNAWQTSNF